LKRGIWSLSFLVLLAATGALQAQSDGAAEPAPSYPAIDAGSTAWMSISTALVMLMVPGLALFYAGMVRRKNVLATMMHSMVALAVVGVYWMVIGYALAFGDPWLTAKVGEKTVSFLGFSRELIFLQGVRPDSVLPNANIPVYLHMAFQGMFAILTPALISGALAERIRFKPYCLFMLIWITVVYCPLAHMVWAMDWNWSTTLARPEAPAKPDLSKIAKAEEKTKVEADYKKAEASYKEKDLAFNTEFAKAGKSAVGYLGLMPSLDFAGGTVVHIAAGFSGLAAFLVLRRRRGYPEQAFHPNSMVLTLTGAGLLWFGWFGFNGGSAGSAGALSVSAFLATQLAAAGAGLSWVLLEWTHRGKPTALGLASGIVAGLVAVTPASGFVFPTAGLLIGLVAGIVCYIAVSLKPKFGYDDSLDAFGVHGIGGFLGAVLTGLFCSTAVNSAGADAGMEQFKNQLVASVVSALMAFILSAFIVKLIDLAMGFTVSDQEETEGLDRVEHGESGFDFGLAFESVSAVGHEPRAAVLPPNGAKQFQVVVEGAESNELLKTWSDLCQPSTSVDPNFKVVYPHMTTVQGNRFRFRGGDPERIRGSLQKLFENRLSKSVKTRVEG
jgi:ammonium transporter